jgi:hypothetical protein
MNLLSFADFPRFNTSHIGQLRIAMNVPYDLTWAVCGFDVSRRVFFLNLEMLEKNNSVAGVLCKRDIALL